MLNILVIAVTADGLAPSGARPSAVTVLTIIIRGCYYTVYYYAYFPVSFTGSNNYLHAINSWSPDGVGSECPECGGLSLTTK